MGADAMPNPAVGPDGEALRLDSNGWPTLQFRGSVATTDAGSPTSLELDLDSGVSPTHGEQERSFPIRGHAQSR